MTPIIVLFNLKAGVSPESYETWAKSTDLPIVRGLKSIGGFDVYKSKGLLRGGDPAPYQYVEMIMVKDMTAFGADVGSETMQRVSGEFRNYADNPTFILCESLV
jgi:hypothetical protein